ncbi:MAG: 1-deoxy-D-xylulose-5-phosphate reductoisomerase [Calditrichaeota bacterium]|nr:1-deoxy-D-xylulose-5-phosphate reductoisomerase [Calditrichota bacterium]MCB9366376.1 1-deoxy-D-xylulose-5-phosphate reductoisomerase [Calditrichota bacterium]MCB9391994.1 1-deoxy-D-xylulose-5-phosphate reductoisomerase [Calditrichota bacterium]
MKRILLQGATGSIGASTLSVAQEQANKLRIAGLSSASREEELLSLSEKFRPESIALAAPLDPVRFEKRAASLGVRDVFTGVGALAKQADTMDYDVLVNAVSGSAGILPTLAALKRGKTVALANKETLVAAGDLVLRVSRENRGTIIPVDSEHSALFQCLVGEKLEDIRTLWLTASGGPFWGRTREELEHVTVSEALSHPTWAMGPKNTVDSATLFNKGLEVMEAVQLFGVPLSAIKVVRHRQSVIHSMVEFHDGSFKAQLSRPDMRLPILYALSYPERWESSLVETSCSVLESLHFDGVNPQEFPCLEHALNAIRIGGAAPTIVSAADEIAVKAFVEGKIGFTEIEKVLKHALSNVNPATDGSLAATLAADEAARAAAHEAVKEITAGIPVGTC